MDALCDRGICVFLFVIFFFFFFFFFCNKSALVPLKVVLQTRNHKKFEKQR